MSSCITGRACRARIFTAEGIAKLGNLPKRDLFSQSSHHWRTQLGLRLSNNGCLTKISATKDSVPWFASAAGATTQGGYCSSFAAAKSDAKQLGDIFSTIRARDS